MIKKNLESLVEKALSVLGLKTESIVLEHPTDLTHGDFSTNVALACAKASGKNPRELANEIVAEISKKQPVEIESVAVAGPGFINFKLSPKFLTEQVAEIAGDGNFGQNQSRQGEKIMVEYTDPNPFKPFHIGHLMSNAIGESIARLFEYTGAKIVRANWGGDQGLHVAKAMFGILHHKNDWPKDSTPLQEKINFLGQAYVFGAGKYEDDEKAKREIEDLNKKLFEKSDTEINDFYEKGRAWSLEHFEEIYHKLGTKFDYYFFEGKEGREGQEVVKEFLKKGVFEESEGAIVFRGDKHGLHTRVFINSRGLPTYEAKELGLNLAKFKAERGLDLSLSITGNEQNEYFKVMLVALAQIFPTMAGKIKHIGHGMLRFASGKMSSRKGNVITGESLLESVESLVHEKIAERELVTEEKNRIANDVAVGAIKYSVLRQAIGGDIIFDFEKSISFEGDSGPYLQYSYARAQSVLRKAGERLLQGQDLNKVEPGNLERLLVRFPEIVERAQKELSPHHIATYLIEIAGAFNSFYANNQIIGSGEAEKYRLMLTKAFTNTLQNGLYLLGIKAPEVM